MAKKEKWYPGKYAKKAVAKAKEKLLRGMFKNG